MPLSKLHKLYKTKRRQGLFLLFLCLLSLLYGMLVDPTNGWWAIPVLVGYIGGSMASSESRRIAEQMNKAWGSPAEEYW
jgi:hypothetical protein